jgi:hypothetical protein
VHVGEKSYGTCDVVPEVFHVATLFVHVYFVPIFPKRSFVYVRRAGGVEEVRIPLSPKSVFLAWARAAAFIGMLAGIIVLVLSFEGRGPLRRGPLEPTILRTAAAAVAFATLMIIPRRRLPSYKRACDLARRASLGDTHWAAINVQYGRDVHDRGAGIETLRA